MHYIRLSAVYRMKSSAFRSERPNYTHVWQFTNNLFLTLYLTLPTQHHNIFNCTIRFEINGCYQQPKLRWDNQTFQLSPLRKCAKYSNICFKSGGHFVLVTKHEFILRCFKSNREQLRNYNHQPSGRTRTCRPVIPVRRSDH